jgi:DNA-binding NarL/FixJ family response regulator
MTNILIADDHPIFRCGLKDLLEAQPEVKLIGEAETGTKALQMARKQRWDVVVLDISMPEIGGMEILKVLKQEQPKLPVLILSAHPENQYAMRALHAGAAGYMTKETAPHELIRALRKILHGGKYISETLAEKLAFNIGPNSNRKPHDLLSDREYDIMLRIASGKSLGMIATELSLSPRTVSTYRSRVLEKMQMTTNAELIRYALENKLID